MEVLWTYFKGPLESHWGYSGLTLGVLLGNFGVPWVNLKDLWGHSAIMLGVTFGYAGFTFEVLQDYFGSAMKVTFGVLWVYFWGTMGVA